MKKKILIHIGQYYATDKPMVIHTLLGSCVAVCLFDMENKIGGMNHIFLPGKAEDMDFFSSPAQYAINAIELLINRIIKLGGKRHNLVAKVFGGANMLPAISKENGIGWRISDFVVSFLQSKSIQIISRDLNGHQSRRVYFHTDTGEVLLKKIPSRYFNSDFNFGSPDKENLKWQSQQAV